MNSSVISYEKKIKENIGILIENNKLEEAKEIVNHYENIVSNDIEIYSIKAVIAMMEGNVYEAERILREGLLLEIDNFDINYNLAYLYESDEKYITAYRYYDKALKNSDKEMIEEVSSKLEKLKRIEKVKEYVGRNKVLMIAYAFPPIGGSGIQRTLKFVKNLRSFGWEPVVLTVGKTAWTMKDESLLEEVPEEVEIVRIDDVKQEEIDNLMIKEVIRFYSNIVKDEKVFTEYLSMIKANINDLYKYLLIPEYQSLWAMKVCKLIDKYVDIKSIDMIYTTADPYANTFIGNFIKKKYNKSWVVDFRDEWTNHHYKEYDKSSITYKVEFEMEKSIVEAADKIITTTPISSDNYRNIFNLSKNKVKTITNGYDEDDFKEIRPLNKKNKVFTIMHNGIFHNGKNPVTFLYAISNLISKNLIDKSSIRVYFTIEDEYKDLIKKLGLQNIVEYLGYLEHKKSLQIANKCDVLLLVVGSGEKLNVVYTGKIFEYLRLGKPILSLAPENGVIDNLINENKKGYNVDYNDVEGIEKYILKLYRNWKEDKLGAFDITDDVRQFERKVLTGKLSSVFEELLKKNSYEGKINEFAESEYIKTEEKINYLNEMESYKKQFKDNMQSLIEQGLLKEAKDVISQYEEIVKEDIDIYSIKGVISMIEGNMDEAEQLLKEGLAIDNENFDLNYNLGYLYEEKALFLDALETYEKIIFGMEDNDLRKQIIEHRNNLEEKNREMIQRQLESRNFFVEEKLYNGKKTNLHLMYDSQYCDKFISFVNENFPKDEHKFIIIHNKNEKLKSIKIDGISNIEILDLRCEVNELIKSIQLSTNIFIHFMFDYCCEIVTRFCKNKPIYWKMWGGDLYYYIDSKIYDAQTKKILSDINFNINDAPIDKFSLQYIYRRVAMRRINKVLCGFKRDYDIANEKFIISGEHIPFIYPNPIKYILMDKQKNIETKPNIIKEKRKYLIQLGNSGDPSNNHIEVINQLSKINSNEFNVVVPLSYGNQNYINFLVKEGYRLLGDRFIPILNYLDSDEYYNILNQVDVAIMNHNRPQGFGNILPLIYLGKKVYLKSSISTTYELCKKGIKVFNVEDLKYKNINDLICIDEETKLLNRNLVLENYNNDVAKKLIIKLLNN